MTNSDASSTSAEVELHPSQKRRRKHDSQFPLPAAAMAKDYTSNQECYIADLEAIKTKFHLVLKPAVANSQEATQSISSGGFIEFFEFCKALSPDDPGMALVDVGLHLTGPYDLFLGKTIPSPALHARYFYDLPEVVTILRGNSQDFLTFPADFHFAFYRDDPHEEPLAVVSNAPSQGYTFKYCGNDIFTSILKYIKDCKGTKKLSSRMKARMVAIEKELLTFIEIKGILKLSSGLPPLWNQRKKKLMAMDLSGLGIYVPYNVETGSGYRPLPCTDKELLSLATKAKQDSKEKKIKQQFNEILTWVTIATDECDFGTALHLGRNLFCCDSPKEDKTRFSKPTKVHLGNAYSLLKRESFKYILFMHLEAMRQPNL
ncbi:hypothetical protein IE077_000953 [Cardiosporidium cionae]|uniref:Uncharacterized protein n=1 Tax=Cardiosporidium cionae TaxID=476202 RepID=A0ABQ7J656_9APIC|nr:hypothetical protein IE077_000953 [Cardiosporidium cionae]|eukprot:KAF8819485.1 hypothetical protein IE077_000953 [Cardiosporidium cionae]